MASITGTRCNICAHAGWRRRRRAIPTWPRRARTRSCCRASSIAKRPHRRHSRRGSRAWRAGFRGAPMWPTQSTELTRARLIAWLSDSAAAALGAGALRRGGHRPSAVAEALHSVTEAPASASRLVLLVEDAKREAGLPAASAAIERWLLAHAAAAMLSTARLPPLGDAVLDRTSTASQIGRAHV